MIKVEKIVQTYQDGDNYRDVLKNVSYDFSVGKFYAIAGPSGSGKTTFLSIIAGLGVPTSGEVYFKDQNINEIGLVEYRKRHASVVFQSYNLITYMTALENVIVAMEIAGIKDREKKAREALELVGLSKTKQERHINKLSGGEQQRVAIARCIATDPSLVLADEPSGNLDKKTEKDIIDIFRKLAHEKNKCVVIVTHSNEVLKSADVKIKIDDGVFLK